MIFVTSCGAGLPLSSKAHSAVTPGPSTALGLVSSVFVGSVPVCSLSVNKLLDRSILRYPCKNLPPVSHDRYSGIQLHERLARHARSPVRVPRPAGRLR